MKNPKLTKSLICLLGLLCFIMPFFKMSISADLLDLADPTGIVEGYVSELFSLRVSGIGVFAFWQFIAGILSKSSAVPVVSWWIVFLVLAWISIPFVMTAAMGISNLLGQGKTTKILTITGGVINTVLFAGVLVYLTANSGDFNLFPGVMSLTGSIGLWLVLIINIVMFVLGINQKIEVPSSYAPSQARRQESGPVSQAAAGGEGGMLMGINGQYSGSNIPIEPRTELILGRDSTVCNLIISGSKISRKHCGIKYDSATHSYRVIDYSSNGTYTSDGKRLLANQYTSLSKGTSIYLGDQSVMFRLD